MQEGALRKVLLIQAIEETDRNGEALPLAERAEATRKVIGNNPPNVEAQAEAPLSSATEWLLVRRADLLLDALRTRSPGIDHVLDVAGGATSLDRGLLVLAFVFGAVISFADGARGGINIFAAPLVLLLAWNVLVYVLNGIRLSKTRIETTTFGGSTPATNIGASPPPAEGSGGLGSTPAGGASASTVDGDFGPSAVAMGGARPSLMGRFYARRVRRQIDNLLGHSTRFNAPLAPGLRRFAGDWLDLAQPLFFARSRRLMHLSAVFAALGLVAAYYIRALVLRSAAGWEGGGAIGPETAHALLVVLYGPASLLSGISIPGADEIAKLRWSAPSLSGIGEPAIWVHLIALTAGLYIILPRLILMLVASVRLWRLSRRLVLPPGVVGYVRTLIAAARSS
jgi:Protein of unknown function (DUF2868)